MADATRVKRAAHQPNRKQLIASARVVAVLASLAIGGATLSTAQFSAYSANGENHFSAAPDFQAPAVELADPGSPLRGSVSLTASGRDPSGITRLTIQRLSSGSS